MPAEPVQRARWAATSPLGATSVLKFSDATRTRYLFRRRVWLGTRGSAYSYNLLSKGRLSFDLHQKLPTPLQDVHTRPQKRKAFIAEDHPDVRETLARILEHEGFAIVGTATTEFAAVDWLMHNEGAWDLAIIDLLLQDGSGFNVVRHFKRSAHPGKIVVYSGFITDGVRDKCLAFGAEAVISKTDVLQLQQILDAFRPRGGSLGR